MRSLSSTLYNSVPLHLFCVFWIASKATREMQQPTVLESAHIEEICKCRRFIIIILFYVLLNGCCSSKCHCHCHETPRTNTGAGVDPGFSILCNHAPENDYQVLAGRRAVFLHCTDCLALWHMWFYLLYPPGGYIRFGFLLPGFTAFLKCSRGILYDWTICLLIEIPQISPYWHALNYI